MEFKGSKGSWTYDCMVVNVGVQTTDEVATIWATENAIDGGKLVASVSCSPGVHEAKENAKLIAAAPELLKVLISLQGDKPLHPSHPKSTFTFKSEYDKAYKRWKKAQDVINKAIGL